ncbi:MAG: NAD(P)-binding protein [Oligoflexia bacterium]|nr:NAD(P)-binding protein [Oligoflexia bacterium]
MITTKTSRLNSGFHCDALVVGAGLSGLLCAAQLLKKGAKVHLTESTGRIGGRMSPELREGFALGSGMNLGDLDWFLQAEQLLGYTSSALIPYNHNRSLLLGSKGWTEPNSLDEWDSMVCRMGDVYPQKGLYGMVESLIRYCESYENFQMSLEAPVTKIEVQQGKVQQVCIGVDAVGTVGELWWTADYKSLMEVLRSEKEGSSAETNSWVKSFVKSNYSPGVVLEFAHKNNLSDISETILIPLGASSKEERKHLIGSFPSNRDSQIAPEGRGFSTWLLPLTEAEWQDNHETMKKIRLAKRLLEKAFPGFIETILFERVLVLENTYSCPNKKKSTWQPMTENLFAMADWAMPDGISFSSVGKQLFSSEK